MLVSLQLIAHGETITPNPSASSKLFCSCSKILTVFNIFRILSNFLTMLKYADLSDKNNFFHAIFFNFDQKYLNMVEKSFT